jgi:hypothetical protein
MNDNVKEILIELEKEFFKELDKKTSWGKNHIKEMFLKVKSDVLLNALNKKV